MLKYYLYDIVYFIVNPEINTAEVYALMDDLALRHAPTLGVPTEVKAFAAEVAADVIALSDDEVFNAAAELDAQTQTDALTAEEVSVDRLLSDVYRQFKDQPPNAYRHDEEKIQAFALEQLRTALVSRKFRIEYPSRFIDSLPSDYQKSEPFLQGSVLAYRIAGEYLAAHRLDNDGHELSL